MAGRAIATLLTSRQEWHRPHQIVVRVGAAVSWFVAAIFLAVGVFFSDGGLILVAVGPLLAAVFMTGQAISGRENGGLALFTSGVVVAVWYGVFGGRWTVMPAAVALVLICAIGMLFVVRHKTAVAAMFGGILFGIPHLWSFSLSEQVALGSIMGISFLLTHLILSSIQRGTAALHDRYQILFEESPAAVLEEEWSEAIAYVRSEYSGKSSRVRQFLLAYPAVVRNAVSRAKIIRANDAALALLDVGNTARFLGYRDADVVDDENLDAFVSALVCLYEGGRTWEREVPIRTRSGELRWLLYRSVDTSMGPPGSTIVAGLADITHMRARNEAMAEVVRTKDEFIANVSHELRTPLTAVIGLTSELMEGDGLSEEIRAEMLHLVASQASEMSNIVDDLLVAARAEVGTVTIDLSGVDLVDEIHATLDGLGMSLELPDEVPPLVHADPRRVRQILRNLLTNARRYGGPSLRVTAGALPSSAWVEVRDNGAGMPEEVADHIFEPYFTSGSQGSVGLGLSVARQLAELMGGSLDYERSAGESVFRLQLPMVDDRDPVMASHLDAV